LIDNEYNEDQSEEALVADLVTRSYKMLMRREYSAEELRKKFRNLAARETVETAIERLIALNAQSDERYAEMLCRARFNAGKGPVRIKHDLSEQRIASEIIESSMAEYDGKWKPLADKIRSRKFGEKPPENYTEWARQARFLQQRGFSAAQIGHFDG
jgi:regulatory protein